MSFQNSFSPDGSININVVPSFGRIIQCPENQKYATVHPTLSRSQKSMPGEHAKEPSTTGPLTSTPAATSPSAPRKSSRSQSISSTSTSMLKDPDSAEDSAFDDLNNYVSSSSYHPRDGTSTNLVTLRPTSSLVTASKPLPLFLTPGPCLPNPRLGLYTRITAGHGGRKRWKSIEEWGSFWQKRPRKKISTIQPIQISQNIWQINLPFAPSRCLSNLHPSLLAYIFNLCIIISQLILR